MAVLRPFKGAIEINDRSIQDDKGRYFLYRLIEKGKVQTGIVGCASIDDYLENKIKKLKAIDEEKKLETAKMMEETGSFSELVSMTCMFPPELKQWMEKWTMEQPAFLDFVMEDDVRHTIWKVSEDMDAQEIETIFSKIECMYVFAGESTAEAATALGMQYRRKITDYTGEENFNYFPAAVFPEEEMAVYPYNRVIQDLNGLNEKAFIGSLKFNFELMLMPGFPCKPVEKHSFGMYTGGEWYHLRAWEDIYSGKEFYDQLDIEILQKRVFTPILKTGDPKTDHRVLCVDGTRKLKELAELADQAGGVAFIMYPMELKEMIKLADEGKTLPDYSAYFSPQPVNGLFVYKLEEILQ